MIKMGIIHANHEIITDKCRRHWGVLHQKLVPFFCLSSTADLRLVKTSNQILSCAVEKEQGVHIVQSLSDIPCLFVSYVFDNLSKI